MSRLLHHANTISDHSSFLPEIFNLNIAEDKKRVLHLLNNGVKIIDTIHSQIEELIKIKNAAKRLPEEEMQQKVAEILHGEDPDNFGNWVYYPWSNKLVHVLSEEDFIAVRTNRNMYKITPEEITALRSKKIAIIGLSVGQSIAQTIATERICGELRLADFDTLELGNLNRLSAGVQDLGTPKVVIAARKIAEIDPYIKVKCYAEGVTENNIDSFLSDGGKADILIEECDSLVVKIISRIKARQLGIPVVMETNDKGMLDVERFDLEPGRAIFHGRVKGIDDVPFEDATALLKKLTIEEKFGYLSKIVEFENTSEEMKLSLSQINKTIISWPQLASAVSLGAAIVTDVCRRIFLGKFTKSGRYFVHFDELIK